MKIGRAGFPPPIGNRFQMAFLNLRLDQKARHERDAEPGLGRLPQHEEMLEAQHRLRLSGGCGEFS